jgi:hypothetical protein
MNVLVHGVDFDDNKKGIVFVTYHYSMYACIKPGCLVGGELHRKQGRA